MNMKRNKTLKAAFAAVLAAFMALSVFPVSAMPVQESEKSPVAPYWFVPTGYNAHDYNKSVAFLEQTDENGVRNGEKLSETYDPNDPGTWGTWGPNNVNENFKWTVVNGEQRLRVIHVRGRNLYGGLDVSGCTALEYLYCEENNLSGLNASSCIAIGTLTCNFNNLSELDVSGCTALEFLRCYGNNLSELDVSTCTALSYLGCHSNNLSELDVSTCTALESLDCFKNNISELNVSGCTALENLDCYENNLSELNVSTCTALSYLSCRSNNLSELDVSTCTALEFLCCYGNNLSELDLSCNTNLAYDTIIAEGEGYIGYYYYGADIGWGGTYAYPAESAAFEGFYDENGALISEGVWSDEFEAYVYAFDGMPSGTVIARFSGGAPLIGDINGDGSVSVLDALLLMRCLMELDGTDQVDPEIADINGDGVVDLFDALLVLRITLGQN